MPKITKLQINVFYDVLGDVQSNLIALMEAADSDGADTVKKQLFDAFVAAAKAGQSMRDLLAPTSVFDKSLDYVAVPRPIA